MDILLLTDRQTNTSLYNIDSHLMKLFGSVGKLYIMNLCFCSSKLGDLGKTGNMVSSKHCCSANFSVLSCSIKSSRATRGSSSKVMVFSASIMASSGSLLVMSLCISVCILGSTCKKPDEFHIIVGFSEYQPPPHIS